MSYTDDEIQHSIVMQGCKPFEDSDVEALKWAASKYLEARKVIEERSPAVYPLGNNKFTLNKDLYDAVKVIEWYADGNNYDYYDYGDKAREFLEKTK